MNDPSVRLRGPDTLAGLLADLDEDGVLDLVSRRIAEGEDPFHILSECQRGLRLVGERYEQGRYYIAGLIMAGEIFRQVVVMVRPLLTADREEETVGKVLLGTVQGDIHDLGKNIARLLLSSHGFEVIDLGVDVPSSRFVTAFSNAQPDVVGLSGLLTGAHTGMKETVEALREASNEGGPSVPIIIGGRVDEDICAYVGADYWCNEAMRGVRLCQRLIKRRRPSGA